MASTSGSSGQAPKSVHVQVVARCRPLNEREMRTNKGTVVNARSGGTEVVVQQVPFFLLPCHAMLMPSTRHTHTQVHGTHLGCWLDGRGAGFLHCFR